MQLQEAFKKAIQAYFDQEDDDSGYETDAGRTYTKKYFDDFANRDQEEPTKADMKKKANARK